MVLVSARQNPKGAVVVLPAEQSGGQVQILPLALGLQFLHAESVVEILCMQERAFGNSGLAAPSETPEPP